MIQDVLSRFSPKNVLETRCHYPKKHKLDLPPNLFLVLASWAGCRSKAQAIFDTTLALVDAQCALPFDKNLEKNPSRISRLFFGLLILLTLRCVARLFEQDKPSWACLTNLLSDWQLLVHGVLQLTKSCHLTSISLETDPFENGNECDDSHSPCDILPHHQNK